jgi:hypothetical protein
MADNSFVPPVLPNQQLSDIDINFYINSQQYNQLMASAAHNPSVISNNSAPPSFNPGHQSEHNVNLASDTSRHDESKRELTPARTDNFIGKEHINKWISGRVSRYLTLKKALQNDIDKLAKLCEHKQAGTFPSELNWRYQGFKQYPKYINATQAAQFQDKELEIKHQAMLSLLQFRIDRYHDFVEALEAQVKQLFQPEQIAIDLALDLPSFTGDGNAIDYAVKIFALECQSIESRTKPAVKKSSQEDSDKMDTNADAAFNLAELQKRIAKMERDLSKVNKRQQTKTSKQSQPSQQKNDRGRGGGGGKDQPHRAARSRSSSPRRSRDKTFTRGKPRSRSSDSRQSRSRPRSSKSPSREATGRRGRSPAKDGPRRNGGQRQSRSPHPKRSWRERY